MHLIHGISQWKFEFCLKIWFKINIRLTPKYTHGCIRKQQPMGIWFWKLSCLVRDIRLIETYNWLKELEEARWFADLLLSVSVDLSRQAVRCWEQ